jgi:hypothetical protein
MEKSHDHHRLQLIHQPHEELGDQSWVLFLGLYIDTICDPDDAGYYNPNIEVYNMVLGIPFHLGIVLWYLIQDFPVASKHKWFLLPDQKQQLQDRVVYRYGVDPPTQILLVDVATQRTL